MSELPELSSPEQSDIIFRFAPTVDGASSLEGDERLALLATSVAMQQRAGFGNYVDIREFHCPACKASGFNGGWGTVRFTCGAEILSDGEWADECPSIEGAP